jgi:hypothetical protein
MAAELEGKWSAPAAWWWNVVAGLLFALAALVAVPVAGLDIGGLDADPKGGQVTWWSLFAGTFLTGVLCWWLVVGRPRRLSVLRGAVTGILVGLTAYVAVIGLVELFGRGSVLESPRERLVHVLEFAAFGVLTTGFGATLVMASTGVLAALGLRSVYRAPPASPLGGFASGLLKVLTVLAGAIVALLCLLFAALSLLPLNSAGLSGTRITNASVGTHEAALMAFGAVEAAEATKPLHPRCHSKLLTHGDRVAEAVVFFHGFTNCPAQFDELAADVFELGYNVYVPLLPRHGEADQMTLALAGLTAEEIAAATEQAIDLASGLGGRVTVVGLSGGGTMAAWAGQYRADADGTIAIAPFLSPHIVPTWATRAAMNLMLLLPNVMVPWDPRQPDGPPAMDYAYPRWASHALAEFIRLGEVVGESARASAPLAPGLGMLINEADTAVSNAMARRLIAAWRGQGRTVDEEVLPRALRLGHDLIDPRQFDANTPAVYPVIIDMIQRQAGETP